jgi:acetyl esterase/lipase
MLETSETSAMPLNKVPCVASILIGLLQQATPAQELPYDQHENIVYAETDGIGLLMDVFTPKGDANGLGIVDVISGAWHSDRGKIRDHERAQTFRILCGQGYTVFAVRPGSIGKFSVPEMIANLNQGLRWVKNHSKDYGIDPDRLGLMGASAGGHLACLAAVTARNEKADTDGAHGGDDTRVRAVAVLFPPTDFLNYNGKPIDTRADDHMARLVRRLAFPQGLSDVAEADATSMLTQISPARLVTPHAPPFLLIHGDADEVVPLQQSEVMLAALKQANVPAELIVKKGGAHPWLTIHEEIQVIAEWFDTQLRAK